MDQLAEYWSGALGSLIWSSMDNTYFDFAGSSTDILRWSNGVDVDVDVDVDVKKHLVEWD